MILKSKLLLSSSCCLLIVAFSFSSVPAVDQDKIVVGPDYKTDPLLTDLGNPGGKQFEFSMPLAESKIFRGDDTTLNPQKPVRKERRIFVYIPAAHKDGIKAPILVTFDGPSHYDQVRFALDNLTISKDPDKRLPAFILISVENGGNDAQGSERGLEYDTVSDRFARFINNEVLPAPSGPINPNNSPFLTAKEIFSNASTLSFPEG